VKRVPDFTIDDRPSMGSLAGAKEIGVPPKRVLRATLTSQTEAAIRSDIISGSLAPGQRLPVTDLSEQYGVSATPLREALQRLAADNLVDIDPRLGATVARTSRTHLLDTYRIREILESLALEDAIDLATEEWERNAVSAFKDFEAAVARSNEEHAGAEAWAREHRAFHDALLSTCTSVWLHELLEILNDHSERYRMISAASGTRDPIGEHAAILDAALLRDKPAAVEALRHHMERTVEVIEASIGKTDSEVLSGTWLSRR
jgi:DNA-binding GntR family transcriptional regulator